MVFLKYRPVLGDVLRGRWVVIAITGTRRSGSTAAGGPAGAAGHDELQATVVVVQVAGRSLALFASRVEEVQPAAQLKHLPGAASTVEGFVNLHGQIVPVLDARRLLGLPSREICLSDLFVIITTGARRTVLHVDGAPGLTNVSMGEIAAASASTPAALRSAGIAQMEDGLLVVHDTDAFVSDHELTQVG